MTSKIFGYILYTERGILSWTVWAASHTLTVILEDARGISNINEKDLFRVQSDLQDNGVFSALCPIYERPPLSWVFITEALYKSIHVSLRRRHNATLYIYRAREFLQYNLFNSRTCEGVQRRRGTAGFKKKKGTFRQGPHTWRHK